MKYIMISILVPLSLSAMERKENPNTRLLDFSTAPEIQVTDSFNSRSAPQKKEFHRRLSPVSFECDPDGNVINGHALNISIRTNGQLPMFWIVLKILAINEKEKKMKLECKTFKEDDKSFSSTITWILPLDDRYTETRSLILNDETGNPVILCIETRPDINQLNQAARQRLDAILNSAQPEQEPTP